MSIDQLEMEQQPANEMATKAITDEIKFNYFHQCVELRSIMVATIMIESVEHLH